MLNGDVIYYIGANNMWAIQSKLRRCADCHAVIEGEGDLFGGRVADRDSIDIPDDEDTDPITPSIDRREGVGLPDGE